MTSLLFISFHHFCYLFFILFHICPTYSLTESQSLTILRPFTHPHSHPHTLTLTLPSPSNDQFPCGPGLAWNWFSHPSSTDFHNYP